MRKCIVLLLLAAVVLPSSAFADAQAINFRCIMQYCHQKFMGYGQAFYDPEAADWTLTGGVGIRDVEQFTLLSLILANPGALNHAAVHEAFLHNASTARLKIGTTIIGMTTSTFPTGQMARQPVFPSSPDTYYGADALMGAYLTMGEWATYDETMCAFKSEALLSGGVTWPQNYLHDEDPPGPSSKDHLEARAGYQEDLRAQYDFAAEAFVSMCGDADGDLASNCNEYWAGKFSYTGTLTARTLNDTTIDGDHGTVTFTTPPTLAVGDMMDVVWDGGGRYSVFITGVVGNAVSFSSSGKGILPAVPTAVFAQGFRYTNAIDASVKTEGMYWGAWSCGENNSSIRFSYNTVNDRVYILSQGELSYDEAAAYPGVRWPHGATIQVRLAEIRNLSENTLVKKVASGNTAWIGATDFGKDGRYDGTLTTRTAATKGVITLAPGHDLRTGKCIVWWETPTPPKNRRDLNVTVSGNVATLTGGTAYDDAPVLPPQGTAVTVTNRPNPEDWYWLTDSTQSPMTYKNWDDGEPNGVMGGEDCGTIRDDGTWNDAGKGAPADPAMEYAVWESINTYADADGNFEPDAFEDKNGDLKPDLLGLPYPDANFVADVLEGEMPLTVQFTDLSVGNGETITARAWDFDNNGTVDSTDKDPTHTYMAADPSSTYTVKLTVTTINASPDVRTNTMIKDNYIGPVDWVCLWGYIMEDQAEDVAADPDSVNADLAIALASAEADTWIEWDLDGDLLPDAAQIALLGYVACETSHPLNESVCAALDDNAELWETDFAADADLLANAEFFAGMAGLSVEMQEELGDILDADLSGYAIYGMSSKAEPPFSGGGDFDGDGLTNLEEWDAVVLYLGEGASLDALTDMFIDAATDRYNFGPYNPDLPVAGIVGLGLLVGSMLAGAALAFRKK